MTCETLTRGGNRPPTSPYAAYPEPSARGFLLTSNELRLLATGSCVAPKCSSRVKSSRFCSLGRCRLGPRNRSELCLMTNYARRPDELRPALALCWVGPNKTRLQAFMHRSPIVWFGHARRGIVKRMISRRHRIAIMSHQVRHDHPDPTNLVVEHYR